MKKVSVIVPNYNHAPYLKERLDSIFNQTYTDFEVILLDDASTDNSVEILKQYTGDKRVSHFIVNKTNSGSPFKQWKKGLSLAKGEYVWIAESDDSCELNFLETNLKLSNKAEIIVAKTLLLRDDLKTREEILHPVFKNSKAETLKIEHYLEQCPIRNVSAIIFRNSENYSQNKNTFSNFKIIGDSMFYFESFYNKPIIYNNDTVSYFRKNKENISSIASKNLSYFKTYFNEHLYFIKKVAKNNNKSKKNLEKLYIKRKFNKIRNRTPVRKKVSFTYLLIYLKYKFYK